MVKEFTKSLRKMQREFNREINKLEMVNKKANNDLSNMIKKKEPKVLLMYGDLFTFYRLHKE
jgi:hypothetical protein